MNREYFTVLFDYNYWARDRLLAVCSDLSEQDFGRENGFTNGSIRGIITHCLDAEYGWRCRFEGQARKDVLTEADLASPALLRERWQQEEASMRAYLASLTDDVLRGDLAWQDAQGNERRLPRLWLSLAHLVNHSTQHRSEAAEALTMIGRSPGDLDLGEYARQL